MHRVLCASLLLVACDGEGIEGTDGINPEPRSPIVVHDRDPSPALPVPVSHVPEEPSHLMSRFGPERGVTGSTVRILTMFDPSGCVADWTCSVTIGGTDAPIVNDVGLLEAKVQLLTQSGPVCVTFEGTTECGEVYTVLPAALIFSATPDLVAAGAADTTVTVYGEAFMEDSKVQLGYLPLATTFHSTGHLSAVVPASLLTEAVDYTLSVYSPSSGRCGTTTEPRDFIVE